MSIEFISGKPGNGKSLLAVKQLVETLKARPDIFFSTNLPLNMPRLCEYLHQKYGETFNAAQRIRLLDDTESSEFWLYPYPGVNLDPMRRIQIVERRQDKGAKHNRNVVDIAAQRFECEFKGAPVTFIIDEIHQYFGAREWAATGGDCLHYLSQHRKLGDDVIAITQAIENVDTQFRRVAQCFHYVKNLRKLSIPVLGGLFKAPPLFIRTEFLSPNNGTAVAQSSSYFTLDAKGIASCYETAAGVGLVGKFADKGHDKKGLPWWVAVVGIAVIAVSVIKVPGAVFKRVLHVGQNKKPSAAHQLQPAATNKTAMVFASSMTNKVPVRRIVKSETVFWTSRVKLPNGRWHLGLSDGTSYRLPDSRVKHATANELQIDDVIYQWGRPASPAPVEQVVSVPPVKRPIRTGWFDL